MRSVIEIPGFYQQHATLFSEPKLERHTRLLRVLPNFKPRLGYGKPVSFELLLLGEDGQIYPFEVFERISTEPFYQENLMDSLFGSMEWIFQRQNYSKRCDISLQYSPQILSTSKYKLNFLCGKFKSLEEITTLGKTSSELLKWKGREQELNNGGISTRYEAKKALYIEAKNSTNQSLCIKEQFRKNVHKAPFSSEYFFSLRRIFASQVGITFLVSYFLNLPLPTPRDFVVSLENGSIPLQHKAMRVNFTEQPPYRLSPCVMAAMNSIDTCKIFMGNTALALEERKELIQVTIDLFFLLLLV